MSEKMLKTCFLASVLFALVASITNLVSTVNAYNTMVERSSKNVVAAFDG